ncbi:MAG: hypothetical protein K8F92_21085 [Hyphomicrobium sp.]|uniref:hypothetical protein n=1 Tax=Hyphomicrobium sp. TaxID=82 RepID=UPI0013265EBC|nr:hypothetical protein [Hyphomicrobium sp.]KAB2942361.1 MAG: hypothetical protein F9K20_07470 [Hyphomicrobium sp.]MBZ0212131.1 hypothetical protein [Hyphomicrobium sp.]MCZ7595529.1 hypothetical protein [Hyphomicrobium sp.]
MQPSLVLASAAAFAGVLLSSNANGGDLGPPPPAAPIVDTVSYRCLRWNEKCEWRWGAATPRYYRCMWRHGCAPAPHP